MQPNIPYISTEELAKMPMQCYGCGKSYRHLTIFRTLSETGDLKQTMDTLGYERMCCRTIIMSTPAIVALQKRLEADRQIGEEIHTMTLDTTGYEGRKEYGDRGTTIVETQTDLLPMGGIVGQMGEDSQPIDTYEYFLSDMTRENGD